MMLKNRSTPQRTLKTTIRQKKPSKPLEQTQQMSSTMEICIDASYDTPPLRRASYIDVVHPDKQSTRIPLHTTEVLIGRDRDCHVTIPISSVSRHHARIVHDGQEYAIEDLDSTNGTFVNNVRVSRCTLRNNDQVRIGQASIVFVQEKSMGSA